MSIKKIEMINFRNHEDIVFNFSPGINIIWGENGSGKTSIIEAVHILSNGKSFKTNRLVETITTKKQEKQKRSRILGRAVGQIWLYVVGEKNTFTIKI